MLSKPLMIGIGALVLILAVLAYFGYQDRKDARHDNTVANGAVAVERASTLEKGVQRAEAAEDARDNPTNADLARVCEKYDRNCPKNN